jgi:hypothetical protein
MDALLSVIAAIVVAVTSAWVTVQLSLQRFRREKWWERKADAYSRIIEALHNAKVFASEHWDASMRGRSVPDEADKELRQQANVGRKEILRASDVGAFLISPEAVKLLLQYQKESEEARLTTSWQEYLDNDLDAVNKCLKGMIAVAKRDLGTD